MSPRNTGTGAVLEHTVLPALERNGYQYFARSKDRGKAKGVPDPRLFDDPFRPSRKHRLDILVLTGSGERIGISAKWQQVGGTAEEKVPMEVLRLMSFLEGGLLDRAYLLLAGNGWSLKGHFLDRQFLNRFCSSAKVKENVLIFDLDTLLVLIKQRKL